MAKKPMAVVVHVDGGSRGNPGPAAAGVVLASADDGTVLFEGGFYLGRATNNVAEYHALLEGLAQARALGADEVEIRSDSELLVRQMNGEYRVKSDRLGELSDRAQRLCRTFARCVVTHVRREENEQADRLVKRALNLKRNVEDAAGGG